MNFTREEKLSQSPLVDFLWRSNGVIASGKFQAPPTRAPHLPGGFQKEI